MTWFREHTKKVFLRRGNMLPEADTDLPGFHTVYRFSEEAAEEIRKQGNSRGFSRFPVFADSVWFDFDDDRNEIKHLISVLDQHKLGYTVYTTGNRGFHVSVPHTPLFDVTVPYTHKKLVEDLGVTCDPTLYQHSRLLRTIGTVHEKTGKPKQVIDHVDGEAILEISLRSPEESRFKICEVADEELLPFLLSSLARLYGNSPGEGRRHTTCWGLARDAARCGLSFETTLELLLTMNASWRKDSKDVDYIRNACEQGWYL